MAISQAHLTNGTGGGAVHSVTTAAFTPTAGKLQLLKLWCYSSFAPFAVDPAVTTTTGLTWVKVATVVHNFGSSQTWVYRAMKPSGIGNGTVTVNFVSAFIDVFRWCIDEFDPVVTTGADGADAIVQSVTGTAAGNAAAASATLAAFSSTDNATYAGFGMYAGDALMTGATYTGGFTQINQLLSAGRYLDGTYWRATNSTANQCDYVGATGAAITLVSLEIASGSPPPPSVDTYVAAWGMQSPQILRGTPQMVASGSGPNPRIV